MSETLNVERWTRAQRAEMKAQPFNRKLLRAFIDHRFDAQGKRKGTGNQIGAIERSDDIHPDIPALLILEDDFRKVEKKADAVIAAMVESHRAGRWAVSIPGIAHTLAGVLLAYVDLHPWRCAGKGRTCSSVDPCTPDCRPGYTNTVGKLWSFAGLVPGAKREWLSKDKPGKRPWCAILKTAAWQIGESFKKLGADSDCVYARLYRTRKALEIERNESGALRDQALAMLELAKRKKWRITDLQRNTWAGGKLQPIGLEYRAGRYATKIFLSHFHHVLHEVEEGCPPPVPYILGPGGHADFIPVPNWPID